MKRTSMRSIAIMAFAALSAALMASAALPPGDEALDFLPKGPLAVVSADRPADLLANAAAFLERSGFADAASELGALTGILKSPDQIEGAEGLENLAGLGLIMDMRRRLVVALYAPAAEGQEPGVVAYLPALDRQRLEEAIRGALAAAGGPQAIFSAAPGGYLAVGIGMEPLADESTGTAALGQLAAYPSSSVVAWVDMKAAGQTLGPLLEGLQGMAPDLSGEGEAADGSYAEDGEYAEDYDWDSYAEEGTTGESPAEEYGDYDYEEDY